MIRRLAAKLCLLSCMLCVWAACQAQDRDQVIVGAATQRMAGGDGGSLSATWTRSFGSGLLSAGVSRSEVGESDWTLLQFGGVHDLPGDWTLSGGVDLGPATIDGAESTFAKFRAEASVAVLERWTLSVEETFVDVDNVRGHLITGGSVLTTADGMSFQARLSGSVQGNLDQQTVAFRFDRRRGRPYFLAGFVFGRSNNHLLLNTPEIEVRTNRWFQGFAGVSIPAEPFEMTIVAESARLGDVGRKALSIAFRFPLGRSG